MKTVLVFFGGQSVEHDVSIITGVMTLNSVDKTKYFPLPVYVNKKGEWLYGKELYDIDGYKNLKQEKLKKVTLIGNIFYGIKGKKIYKIAEVSLAINCMHGERGEDGSLSGYLSMCGVPLASPDILSSSVAMDKAFTKKVAKALKVNALPYVAVTDASGLGEKIKDMEFPIIVKPNRLGSSIGINRAENIGELESAINYALRFGDTALLEPCLEDFIEINCSAYARADGSVRVSECERPVGRGKVLSFDDKYLSGKRVFPADIEEKISKKIKEYTRKLYRELGFSGVVRIDYFVVNEKVYLNEINTVPGSLAYYLFCDTLKEFGDMLNELFEVALKGGALRSSFTTDYSTGILCFTGGKSAKRL